MKRTALSLPLLSAWLLCSCMAGGDPYSAVAPSCMQQDPDMGKLLILTPDALWKTYLAPECKSALESVIPYDEQSFAGAPKDLKDKVTEALQAIIAYPLSIPAENKLFQVWQPPSGAIPLFFLDVYRDSANPNQSLFNYILSNIDVIRYGGDAADGSDAKYFPAISAQPRRMTIYHSFWDPDGHPFDNFRHPFTRAATLAHEARHGDGNPHTLCDKNKTGVLNFECDSELSGAYGFGTTYLHYLLLGSASCQGEGCRPPLPKFNIMLAGAEMCRMIKTHVNHRFANLENLLGAVDCDSGVSYDWVMKNEGLAIPPSQLDEPAVAVTAANYGPVPDQHCNFK